LRLSVDDAHQGGEPINRDTDLPRFMVNGRVLTDQRAMRRNVILTTKQHLARLRKRWPGHVPMAFVSDGNLLANYWFVAWLEGRLFHLAQEPVFTRTYTCIVAWRNGTVSVEEIRFARENGRVDVLRQRDSTLEDVTSQVGFCASGQPLVRHGQRVPLCQIAEEWYDTRHLVTPLTIRFDGAALYMPNAQLQQGLIRKALVQPVHIRLETQVDEQTRLPLTTAGWAQMAKAAPAALARAADFLRARHVLGPEDKPDDPAVLLRAGQTTEVALNAALARTDYHLVDDDRPLREGEARFINGHLEVFLRKAVYPHNIFARWPDGACGFVVYPGKSGRQGTTLPRAQQFLAEELNVQDAILLDNGGDVRLWYRGRYVVPSSEHREEVRALLALTASPERWMMEEVHVS
jgi:hypothetical protein